jgi:ABC-type protease/lipase transport system fused ATPase/permease subunit
MKHDGMTEKKSEVKAALATCRSAFFMTAAFSAFINLLMLVSPLYMMQVYDRVLHSKSEATLLMLTLITVGLLGVMAMLEVIRSRILVRVGGRMDQLLSERILSAQFQASLHRIGANPGQASRDFDTVRQFLTGAGIFAFFDAPWTPLILALMFMFHPVLGLIALVGGIALFGLALINEAVTKKVLEAANKNAVVAAGAIDSSMRNAEVLEAMGAIDSSMRNAEVLEAMGMFGNFRDRWAGRREEILRLQSIASDRAGVIMGLTKFIRLLLQTAILGGGAYLAIHEQISPGLIIAGSIMMGRALAPVEQAIGTWKQFVGARIAHRRLNELLSRVPKHQERVALPRPTGDLKIESVVVVPPGSSAPTLSRVSFDLPAGQVLGVIGPSGAGKSTLARLLVGAWRPYAGTVRIDGADLHNWDPEARGDFMGYLPQDVELFDGSVAENIARFGEMDSEAIVTAAKRAGVHDMILHLPQGYDTPIGTGGCALSGGQRQRIGLARAVYGGPCLVILDEPNSNLDDEGEAALVYAITELKRSGTTVVIISHRPSILGVTDQILVLAEGTVRMFGNRAEVLARFTRPVVATAPAAQPGITAQQAS